MIQKIEENIRKSVIKSNTWTIGIPEREEVTHAKGHIYEFMNISDKDPKSMGGRGRIWKEKGFKPVCKLKDNRSIPQILNKTIITISQLCNTRSTS